MEMYETEKNELKTKMKNMMLKKSDNDDTQRLSSSEWRKSPRVKPMPKGPIIAEGAQKDSQISGINLSMGRPHAFADEA